MTVDVSKLSLKGLPGPRFHVHQFRDSAVQCDQSGNNTRRWSAGTSCRCGMEEARDLDDCKVGEVSSSSATSQDAERGLPVQRDSWTTPS